MTTETSPFDRDDIYRRFSEIGSEGAPSISDISQNLAEWIESRASLLQENDIDLLVAVGTALHFTRLEQEWTSNLDSNDLNIESKTFD